MKKKHKNFLNEEEKEIHDFFETYKKDDLHSVDFLKQEKVKAESASRKFLTKQKK
jgi:hypothetical protein